MKKVKFTTNAGNIVIQLNEDKSPLSCENFLDYARSGFYNDAIFHRMVKSQFGILQGGGYDRFFRAKTVKAPIKLESDNGLSNKRGTIAMARTNVPDSGTSQFYFNFQDNLMFDKTANNLGYAVFGEVIEGMDVIDNIANIPTCTFLGQKDWPKVDVVILAIEVSD